MDDTTQNQNTAQPLNLGSPAPVPGASIVQPQPRNPMPVPTPGQADAQNTAAPLAVRAPDSVPMLFPGATKATLVPNENLQDAIQKDGGRIVTKMYFPGATSSTWVPLDRVHDAIKKDGGALGYRPQSEDGQGLSQAELGSLAVSVAANATPAGANPLTVGVTKGAMETLHTGGALAGNILPNSVRDNLGLPASFQQPAFLESSNTGESIGKGAEGIAEFVMGDEALKGLSLAERMGIGAKVAKLAEAHPAIAKIIDAGLNAFRTGTVGTSQASAHGASPAEALTTGAVAGGTGLALEGAAGLVNKVAPQIKNIAGEVIPVRASQTSGLADVAENVAPTNKLQEFDIRKTQPAAKRAIGNVASDIGSKEIGGQSLASTANNLEERAAQIKAQSSPVFEKLDDLTKNEPVKFTDLQKQERAAFRQGDIEAANKAKASQENILNRYQSQFAPDDYSNARANWKQASAMEQAHDSLNAKGIVTSTPVKFRPVGAPDPGYIKGKNFANTVLALRDDGTLAQAGLSPTHVQALQDIGTTLEQSSDVHKLSPIYKVIEAATGTVGTAGTGYAASRFLGRLMTNEQFAKSVVEMLRSGAGPGIASQAYRRGKAVLGNDSDYEYDPDSKDLKQ